ncbi:MAG: pseudouridine synthase, partial [Planctomycetaceae bacterium]
MKPDSRQKPSAAVPASDDQPKRIRLQRVLAAAGLGSRRHCEEYIVQGRVTVDGVIAKELGTTVDPQRQKIACDGEIVRPLTKRYFVFNKPKGVLCTNRDPQGRPRVIDYVGGHQSGLFPVGRLDENSQGLIVVTNDGELAERLAHPRYRVPRTYQVQVAGFPSPETLLQMVKGLYFQEGKFRVQSVARVKTQGESTILDVTLNEGQNREIRRLFARMGHKVLQLERVSFGPLRLGKLAVGDLRPLTTAEVRSLKEFRPDRQQKAPAAQVSPDAREERKPRSPAPERDRRRTLPSPA